MRGTRGKKADEKGIQEDDTNIDQIASKPEAEAQKKNTNDKTIPLEKKIANTEGNDSKQRKQLIEDRLKDACSHFIVSQSVLNFFGYSRDNHK